MIHIKKIGKKNGIVCAVHCFVFSVCAEPTLSLHVTDSQGREISQVAVGVPVIVKAVVSGTGDNMPEPVIQGIEKLPQSGTQSSVMVQTINGSTTMKKEYKKIVRFDNEGTFTIGPAAIVSHGLESSKKKIIVSAETTTDAKQHRDAFIVTAASKKEVYSGEPLNLSVTFFYAGDHIKIDGIEKPVLAHVDVKEAQGPISGQEEHDGIVYSFVRWNMTLFPKKAGDFVIGAIRGTYSEQTQHTMQGSAVSAMHALFSGVTTKEAYSNGLKIKVVPLPDTDAPVFFVGDFKSAQLSVSTTSVRKSEGLVATLSIVGEGNSAYVDHPSLTMPDQMTYYDSNARLGTHNGVTKKEYDYVLQGLSEGTYTIESQTITYFDTRDKQYKSIKTQPLMITIMPGTVAQAAPKDSKEKEEEQRTVEVHDQKGAEDSSTVVVGDWQKKVVKQPLSPVLFFLLFILIVVLGCVSFIRRYLQDEKIRNAPERAYKNAFKEARATFNKARMLHYDGLLYHMFIVLFAARKKIAVTSVTEQMMEQALYDAGMAEKDVMQWRLLFAQLAESAFTAHKQENNRDAFFNKARVWLHEWEKIV